MKLTVVGCSGSFPGPDSPASCYLVEADARGPHLADPARPRQRCARGAAPVRRPAGHRRRVPEPPARRPLPGPVRLLRHAEVPPRAVRSRGIPVWGPDDTAARMARAYDLPRVPGMTEEFDFRTYDGPVELRPVPGRGGPRRAPGAGVRPAGDRRRPDAGLLRRHRTVRGPRAGRRRAPTCCWPRRRSGSATTTPRASTSPAATSARPPPGPASGGSCSPTSRRGTSRCAPSTRRRPPGTARSTWPSSGRRTCWSPDRSSRRSDPAVRPVRRRARRSRSAPGWWAAACRRAATRGP